MKKISAVQVFLVFALLILPFFQGNVLAGNEGSYLARKLAVATYFEQRLQQSYGMAVVSVQDNNETLQISMVSITNERIDEVLNAGVYREAKKATFKRIKFIDINQNATVVNFY